MTVVYFAARDDASAAEAEHRPGGSLGRPVVTGRRRAGLLRWKPIVTELGPAYDGFEAHGYEPVVIMGTLEALLTGREYDEVTRDPRWNRDLGDMDDAYWVTTLTDGLRDALTEASDGRLTHVAREWGDTEELRSSWDDAHPAHLAFLTQLRALAQRARSRGEHLYGAIDL